MRQIEQDGEHIWLRQSVTFTANGQTRTVEIAIPLRPGAPPEEIERLLAEADAGMWRISQRLDSHVAALLNGAGSAASIPNQAPVSSTAAVAEAPRPPTPAAPSRPTAHTERPAQPAAPVRPAAHPASPPSRPSPEPAVASTRPRPNSPPVEPALTAASTKSAPAGSELSRKDFLSAAAELGLNAKQVMERLGVRTLEGLNLREALEALRRQLLRDGDAAPDPIPAAAPSAPGPEASSPRYFEEEDGDYEVTFTMDGDDALAEELGAYEAARPASGASAEAADDLEDPDTLSDLDLDDVPDFGPPPSAAHASHAAHAPARRNASAKPAPAPSAAPAAPLAQAGGIEPATSSAAQRVAQLRAIRGGGAPTTHQRSAYRNVVVSELGEPEAIALIRGIWRVNPERLGPDQLDALISWGKQDIFAEEAASVLAALRTARQQATAEDASTSEVTPQPTPRSRAPQPPRAPSGGR